MAADLLQILIYLAILLAGTLLLGGYMARVFAGERTLLSPVLVPLERAIYGACGSTPARTSTGPLTRSPCWRPTPSAGCCST